MRHTYYTCDRCGRSSLSTAGIITLTAGTYTQDEIDHDPDLENMSGDEMTVHLCPICWGKVKRMIESKRVADDEPHPDHVNTIRDLPSAQPEWNNHTVACLLAELFDDTCACNYNGIDEWLPGKCELLDSCPNPVGVACWEQYLKHRAERRTDE